MSFVSSITTERDYNATLSYAEKKGLEKGRQLEREIAEKEIATFQAKTAQAIAEKQKAEAEIQKAYMDKLESARKMKRAGLPLAQISDFTSLPLDVVEKL